MLITDSTRYSTTTFSFFFFNDTATTEIYTLSLHDALPIYQGQHDRGGADVGGHPQRRVIAEAKRGGKQQDRHRSEEHTSEPQSLAYLVCRLLLEKKKKKQKIINNCTSVFTYVWQMRIRPKQ